MPIPRLVHINQIITEEKLVSRSSQLESALQSGQLIEFCQNKVMNSNSDHEKLLWQFLGAYFEASPRSVFLNLLGFQGDEIDKKLSSASNIVNEEDSSEISKITNKLSELNKNVSICHFSLLNLYFLLNKLYLNTKLFFKSKFMTAWVF